MNRYFRQVSYVSHKMANNIYNLYMTNPLKYVAQAKRYEYCFPGTSGKTTEIPKNQKWIAFDDFDGVEHFDTIIVDELVDSLHPKLETHGFIDVRRGGCNMIPKLFVRIE